ncbi:MAG: hypothetical protein WD055_01215 [Candidatus Dependentiae bacterium]
MIRTNKIAVLALLCLALPAVACKIKLVNDSTTYDKNVRVLVNDESAKDLKEGVISGRTLRRLDARKIKPCAKRDLGSKYKLNQFYVYEKVSKNQYKLIAIVGQTVQAGKGQELLVNLSDLKANNVSPLLKVTLK